MKSTTIHFYFFLVSSSMTIASVPRPEFIWYLYPKWNNQLYGYNPAANTSFLPKSIIGEVLEQRDEGIHSVALGSGSNKTDKIVLGTLADTLGNMTALPAFTISFLYRIDTLPLPEAVSVRIFVSSPRRQKRENSNPVELRLIQTGDEISFHAAVGHHDLVTESARVNQMAKKTEWFHVSIMYTGSNQNETQVYVNGTKMAVDIYESPIAAQPPNPTPYEYSIGYDESKVKFSISWFQVFRGVLSSTEAMELSEATFSQALKTVQVEASFTITAVSVQEDAGSINLMAMRTGNAELASAVRFSATSDSAVIDKDFSFQSKEFIFKPGEIHYSIEVSILKDDWTEDNEIFTISMTSLDGVTSIVTNGSVTVTINSNVGPAGREPVIGEQTDEDICLIPLILLCVGIGLVSLGIIILIGFLIKLCC